MRMFIGISFGRRGKFGRLVQRSEPEPVSCQGSAQPTPKGLGLDRRRAWLYSEKQAAKRRSGSGSGGRREAFFFDRGHGAVVRQRLADMPARTPESARAGTADQAACSRTFIFSRLAPVTTSSRISLVSPSFWYRRTLKKPVRATRSPLR